jgi:hypothetical protein
MSDVSDIVVTRLPSPREVERACLIESTASDQDLFKAWVTLNAYLYARKNGLLDARYYLETIDSRTRGRLLVNPFLTSGALMMSGVMKIELDNRGIKASMFFMMKGAN